MLLKLMTQTQDGGQPKVTLQQTITRPDGGDIWALSFDSDGVLWVTGASSMSGGDGVTTYVYNDVTQQVLMASYDTRLLLKTFVYYAFCK